MPIKYLEKIEVDLTVFTANMTLNEIAHLIIFTVKDNNIRWTNFCILQYYNSPIELESEYLVNTNKIIQF